MRMARDWQEDRRGAIRSPALFQEPLVLLVANEIRWRREEDGPSTDLSRMCAALGTAYAVSCPRSTSGLRGRDHLRFTEGNPAFRVSMLLINDHTLRMASPSNLNPASVSWKSLCSHEKISH